MLSRTPGGYRPYFHQLPDVLSLYTMAFSLLPPIRTMIFQEIMYREKIIVQKMLHIYITFTLPLKMTKIITRTATVVQWTPLLVLVSCSKEKKREEKKQNTITIN
jgi:hypothetical protein